MSIIGGDNKKAKKVYKEKVKPVIEKLIEMKIGYILDFNTVTGNYCLHVSGFNYKAAKKLFPDLFTPKTAEFGHTVYFKYE